jgi:hypothetical protein
MRLLWGKMGVNRLNKFIFWFSVIVLAFMPFGIIMSFALLLLYYGVPYIKSEFQGICEDNIVENTIEEPKEEFRNIKEFSDKTLDEMR